MKGFFFALLVGLFFSVPAFAGGQCYSPDELRAEQLLRLHSELMVITVTCHQGSGGENLVPAYTGFTKTNIKALHAAEQTMIRYYKTNSGGDGLDQLDRLRTKLGNEYGQKVADLSAPIFCEQYRDRVLQLCTAKSGDVNDEVDHMVATEDSYASVCTSRH